MTSYLGRSLRRSEDHRLLQGRGAFVDDIHLPDALHACAVRSPHASARIRSVDAADAVSTPGVVTVLTGEDLRGVLGDVPTRGMEGEPGVEEMRSVGHPVLARDRVCYVGQAVAVVVATDRYAARDAADLVRVDYEPMAPAGGRARGPGRRGHPGPSGPGHQRGHADRAGGRRRRGGLRPGRSPGVGAVRRPAPFPRAHRDQGGAGQVRGRRRHPGRLVFHAGAPPAKEAPGRRHGHAHRPGPGRGPGRGRRFRREEQHVPRGVLHPVPGETPGKAREVDRGPAGEHAGLPRSRLHRRHGGRRGRGRRHRGDAGEARGGPGRLLPDLDPSHPPAGRPPGSGALQDPGGQGGRFRRLHQQASHRRLSRGGRARVRLLHRAHHGPDRPRPGPGPGGGAAAEPDTARRLPLRHTHGTHLRLGRLPARPGPGAGALGVRLLASRGPRSRAKTDPWWESAWRRW